LATTGQHPHSIFNLIHVQLICNKIDYRPAAECFSGGKLFANVPTRRVIFFKDGASEAEYNTVATAELQSCDVHQAIQVQVMTVMC
jgi:hypothetical protein